MTAVRAGRMIVAATAFIGVLSCAAEKEPVSVYDVVVSDDGRTLDVGIEFCGNARVDVEETDDVVTLTAWGGADAGGDCASGDTVVLDRPLGDRRLVDGSTGDDIAPR